MGTAPSSPENPTLEWNLQLALTGGHGGLFGGVRQSDLDAEVTRALSYRLLAASPTAELAHVALAALVAAFLFHAIPWLNAVLWALVVTAFAIGRVYWRQRALRMGLASPLVRRGMRAWVALTSAVWGLGAAWLTIHAPFAEIALVFVVLAGLVAGAMVTLMPDLPAFRILMACVLGPPVVGLVASGLDHDHIAAVILILVFAAFEWTVHRRAHLALVDHERTKAVAVRQREYLGTLFANAPTAMVAVDADSRVLGVNARFETLFGYTAADAVGHVLDELIVPPDLATASATITERVHAGGTVVAEVERRGKNGRLIPLIVSAATVRWGDRRVYLVMYEDHSEQQRMRVEREHLIAQLQESLGRVKLLSGLLPICAGCKRIRDTSGTWQEIEVYVHERSEAEFSHGMCPVCAPKYFGRTPQPLASG